MVAATASLSSSPATGLDKVAYPMPKHLPCSDVHFLLYVFNFSLSLRAFSSIQKTSSITSIDKMAKPFVSIFPSGLSLLQRLSGSFLNI